MVPVSYTHLDVYKRQGLQFGLWVEPEMISVDSDLYRAHPDWAIQVPGYEHTHSRNQLVLDFSNKEVVAYIKQVLDDILGKHEIIPVWQSVSSLK